MLNEDEIIDKDEVLKMARQAGFHIYNNCADGIVPDLERFAKLVDVKATARERARIYAEQLGDSTIEATRARGQT